jgi:hypothetical protein
MVSTRLSLSNKPHAESLLCSLLCVSGRVFLPTVGMKSRLNPRADRGIGVRRPSTCMKKPAVRCGQQRINCETLPRPRRSLRPNEHVNTARKGSFCITIIRNKRSRHTRVCRCIIHSASGTVHDLAIMVRTSRSAGSVLAEHIR